MASGALRRGCKTDTGNMHRLLKGSVVFLTVFAAVLVIISLAECSGLTTAARAKDVPLNCSGSNSTLSPKLLARLISL